MLGVLTDGIEPGVDMVMAKLTSPDDRRRGGIWEGMSGSPVYAADGSLIGAVSYTLAWAPTPIAGITPWEDMQQYAGSQLRRRTCASPTRRPRSPSPSTPR